MQSVFGLILLIAYSTGSAPSRVSRQAPSTVIPIVSYINENNYDGSYKYSYETGDGISVSEEGLLKNPGQEGLEAQSAKGEYSYIAPDGRWISVSWFADETGFHAEGEHLPKSPGVGNKTTTFRPPAYLPPAPVWPRGK